MNIGWKLPVFALAAAAVAGWLAVDQPNRAHALSLWHQLSGSALHAGEPPRKDWIDALGEVKSNLPGGVIELTDAQAEAVGLRTATVKTQTEPVILRLTGVTDYDPATLTVIRSMFDCRIDKVLVDFGAVVTVGDPLLEVFSTDLAQAKSDYETAPANGTATRRSSTIKPHWLKARRSPARS